MSLVAAALGLFAARACGDEIKCGACGTTPEQVYAKYGRPTEDVVTICGEKSPDPFQCRKLKYNRGIVFKETHILEFVPLDGQWGLAACVHAAGSKKPDLLLPCARR